MVPEIFQRRHAKSKRKVRFYGTKKKPSET